MSVPADLVLRGVAVVDTRSGAVERAMSVSIAGGRITAISAGGAACGAEVVDADGLYVVPGFLDMHCHPLDSSDPQGALALMLANGVTGFRQMSGAPHLLERRGELAAAGTAVPELLGMPGTILTRVNAPTPDAAVEEVRRQKAQGADFIKVIDVAPDAFFAALDEAKAQDLPFVGHLPPSVPVVAAARAGMRSIEHLGPRDAVCLGCSHDETTLRAAIAAMPAPPPMPPSGSEALRLLRRALVNPVVFTSPAEFARYDRVVSTYSDERCERLAADFIADGTWQVPTLIRLRTMAFGDDPRYAGDPNLSFVPSETRSLWAEIGEQFSRMPPEARRSIQALYAVQVRMVGAFHRAGVKMMAGSDQGGGWIVPGFGLHQEFDLLAEAGLSPLAVLQMATLNAAPFLRREDRMGTVEVGRDANLVLLDGDPTGSTANLHRIAAVVRGGRYFPQQALAAMKRRVEERCAAA